MRTDWYKGIDPNLTRLAEILGMARPSHGYTVAEKSPEVVTAPGVYFPARKGEVIPLESRQMGGNVSPPTTTLSPQEELLFMKWYGDYAEQLGLNPDPNDPRHFYDYRGAFKSGSTPNESGHWPSQFKSEEHPNLIVNGVDTRTGIPLESRQFGGEVNPDLGTSDNEKTKLEILKSIISNVKPTQNLESRQFGGSVIPPQPSFLDELEKSKYDILKSAVSVLKPQGQQKSPSGERASTDGSTALPKSPSSMTNLPTSKSFSMQPNTTRSNDVIDLTKNKEGTWSTPMFSRQVGGVVTPPTEEDEYERLRRLLQLGPPAPEGDILARERLQPTLTVSDIGREMGYGEEAAKAKSEQAIYDAYLSDKELREAAGISPRSGMPEYEANVARMREKFPFARAKTEGELAKEYIAGKSAEAVAGLKTEKAPAPHLVQNEKGEYVWATPGGVLPAGIMGKTTPVTSEVELIRGDLRRTLGKEPTEGEVLNEIDRRKLNVQMGGIPPLSPAALSVPKVRGIKNESALGGMTEEQKGIVRGLTDYKYPWPGSFAMRDPKWQALMGRAEMYDPSFSAAEYQVRYNLRKSFVAGKEKDDIKGLNTATGHINSLVKAKNELDNSNWPTANAAVNLLARYFPVTQDLVKRQGAITAVKTKFNAVADEMAGIFKRTGATDTSIKAWKDTIRDPSTATPEMWNAFISGALELMGSRIEALRDIYETGMGRWKDFRLLSESSRKILGELGVDVDKIDRTIGQETASMEGEVIPRLPNESIADYLKRTGGR